MAKTFKKFTNPHISSAKSWVKQIFLWKFGFIKSNSFLKAPKNFTFPVTLFFDSKKPWAVRVNHSTFLLKLQKLHFLTDPIFSHTCSPLSFIGPKRHHAPALDLIELPPIDYVFISHDHYDHFDKKSCLKLASFSPETHFIVPLGLKNWFDKKKLKATELGWWETAEFKDLKVTSVPAQHFSGRRLIGRNRTLWAGYVLESFGKKVYFAGDTGYNSIDFKKIGKTFQSLDLSLLPIGAYEPRAIMSSIHVNPQEAIEIHKDTFSKLSLAMHYGTFKLTDEEMPLPPYELFLNLKKAQIPLREFMALKPGEYVNF